MKILSHLQNILEILLAMSGVVVRRMTWLRTSSILASLAVYWYCLQINTFTLAVWYFALATLIHYVLLFGMFTETRFSAPWSKFLIQRFGEEQGFRIYEAWMAFVFFHNGASTSLMVSASTNQGLELLLAIVPMWLVQGLAILLSCIGLPVKVWATAIVGIDTYYYRDLFLRRSEGDFKVQGPYKIFQNPMYGVGHLHGYGTALVAASLPGLVIVALNQACVWLFYLTVEKPHVEKVYQKALL
jgi:protein-S-isoprenylcysteine O-methyltransferase Ste14